ALAIGAVEHLAERRRRLRHRLRAARGRACCQPLLGVGAQALPVGEEILVEQAEQQVLGVDLGVAAPARVLLRGCDRLLALECQLVEVHVVLLGGVAVPPDRRLRRVVGGEVAGGLRGGVPPWGRRLLLPPPPAGAAPPPPPSPGPEPR